MAINFNSIESIIGGFNKVLSLSAAGGPPPIPVPLILTGAPMRPGLSPTKIAARIIGRKSEAGLPVGLLPSGAAAPDELMWQIAVEEIISAIQTDALVTVAIPPGITLSAAGISIAGPVTVAGSTIMYAKGYGIIQ